MRTMNFKLIALILAIPLLGTGCADDDVLQGAGDVTPNPGVVSSKNFSVLFSEVDPTIIDPDTGTFTKTDLDVTVYIGDRNNQQITDPHTIYFKSEYGLIEPSCITDDTGSCSVKWSAIDFPESGGPGDDGYTTIVAYTSGEESFTDNNGNGIFDDDDDPNFNDLEEPYINLGLRSDSSDNIFDGNDVVIDTKNGNDLTGSNEVHDIADGFFNGGGCTHSSLCSTIVTNGMIWVASANGIGGTTTPAALTYNVGGDISSLIGSVTLQNNGTDDLTINADGVFTFNTALADSSTYNVTVSTQPTGQICTITNGSGTISTADVTNVAITCGNTYTVGGDVTGLNGTVVLQNNLGDDLSVIADGTITFATALADGSTYDVTVLTQPAGQTCIVGSGSGTLASANVTNVAVTCSDNTIGGTMTGLVGDVTLQNNLGDDLIVTGPLINSPFTFSALSDNGALYSVTVLTQPLTGETCTATNNTGTVTGAVDTVTVDCI